MSGLICREETRVCRLLITIPYAANNEKALRSAFQYETINVCVFFFIAVALLTIYNISLILKSYRPESPEIWISFHIEFMQNFLLLLMHPVVIMLQKHVIRPVQRLIILILREICKVY